MNKKDNGYTIHINGDIEKFNKIEKILLKNGHSWCLSVRKNALENAICFYKDKKEPIGYNSIEKEYSYSSLITFEEFLEMFGETNMLKVKNNGVVHVNGNAYMLAALSDLFLSKGFTWTVGEGKTLKQEKDFALSHYFYFNLDTNAIGGIEDKRKIRVYSLEEVFSLFLFKPIKVKLNSNHEAVVEKHCVKVGCQTFTFNSVEKLYEAVQKVKNSN